ncbi:MAG TPA: hypothetical protein VG815_07905, partial [Chloroflexota bacterium]|nr:hypothetical protein [Chloroflexota bacterium]
MRARDRVTKAEVSDRAARDRGSFREWLAIFGLGLCVYLLTLPADLRGNADTLYRFNVTKSLVDHLTSHFTCRNPNDPRTVFGLHGCWYTIYAPGQTLAMIPLYEIGKLVSYSLGAPFDFATALAARMLDPIMGALALVVFFALCLTIGYRRQTAILLTVILGFDTTLWPDVQSGQDTPQITLFLLLAGLALIRGLPEAFGVGTGLWPNVSTRTWLLLSGVASGLGVLTRYDFMVYVVVLAVIGIALSMRRVHDQLGRSSGVIPPVDGGTAHVGPGADQPGIRAPSDGGHPYKSVSGTRKQVLWSERIRETARVLAPFGIGVLPFVTMDALWNAQRFGKPWSMGQSAVDQFGFPVWQGIPNLLISPAKGLIWYVPALWLLPFVARQLFRRRPEVFFLFAALAVTAIVFYANVIYWHGDPGWGPRYLYPVAPFLVLPLGELFHGFGRLRIGTKGLIAGALALSLAVQVAAVSVDGWRFWYNLVQIRQVSGQTFRWDYTRYDYYWTRNLSL